MKRFCILCLMLFAGLIEARAQIYMTTTAKVSFFSKTPVQDISAVNSTASSLINAKTDSVFFRMKNSSFEFENALMRDHFNENYMESTKYPIDSFRGKIEQKIDFKKDGQYKVTANGKLTIHGVERPVNVDGVLTVKGETIHLESQFFVKTADYHIEVPRLVFEKIAESIKVTLNADYKLVKK